MATKLSADAPEPSAAAADTSSSFWRSVQHAQSAVHSLSAVLGPLPDPHLAFSDDPAAALLRDPAVSAAVSRRLRLPSSGAGDDHLCRWLYDTFHSAVPALRLAVLSFLPALAGAYLSRSSSSPSHSSSGPRHPLAGFEAVLLALYAHETVRRGGEPETATLPSLAAPSIYHEVRPPSKKAAAESGELGSSSSASRPAVVSPALEPHGTVRSTRRARIVGVALELYYSNVSQMPDFSKLEFCEFCIAWSGQGAIVNAQKQGSSPPASASRRSNFEGEVEEGKRIPLPWELFQPMLRIVGHCLLGSGDSAELRTVAYKAAQCLYTRAAREIDSPAAILASRSLIRLGKIAAAETEAAVEEAATEVKTAASEAKEPETEAATEVKTAAPEAKEPTTEAAIEAKRATPDEELATEATTEVKTSVMEAKAKEPAMEAATEAKTAAPEVKELATEAATQPKTATPEEKTAPPEEEELAMETAREVKTAVMEPATEATTEVTTTMPEAKESATEEKIAAPEEKPAMEAATEAKTALPEAKESATEAATDAKESATEAATEAKTAGTEAKEPATEAKESAAEAKDSAAAEVQDSAAAEAQETAADAKESDAAEVKKQAAEANHQECSELKSIEADAQSA